MKTEQTFQAQYLSLLKKLAAAPNWDSSTEIIQLGKVLARADLPPDFLVKLHEGAFQQIPEGECETLSAMDSGQISRLLGGLFTGYCQSLHERILEQRLQIERTHREERFYQAFESGPLLMMISRIRDDLILDVNDSFLRTCGYTREEVVGHTTIELGILVDPNDRDRSAQAFREGGRTRDFEAKMRMKSGEIRIFLTSVETEELDGEPCFLRMAYDITERKQTQEMLLASAFHDAFHDSLTGLPNRELFMDRLDRSVERAKRHASYAYAVFFLDIDHLKTVNDNFGHMIGDQLLSMVARRLEACTTSRDTVARLSGDEFAILLEDAHDSSQAVGFAEKLTVELSKPFALSDQAVSTSVSIGIALSTSGYKHPEQALRDADKAMYRAKSRGGGRYEVFDPVVHAKAVARLKMKTDMLLTFEQRGFHVNYQPVVDLRTGAITGFEALGRWQHPDRGLVSPVEFIPIAEETGLIIDIGRWMLQEACGQIQAWQAQYPANPPLGVSVNLSSKEFSQPGLIATLAEILTVTGLEPPLLRLEITEGVIMEAPEERADRLSSLRELGVQVHIDDFGTGHSSLSFMYQFPIDALKIARSFIHRMGPQGENTEVVRTIVMLARDFGMRVIAEGIETATQLEQLRNLNCRFGQGFYFARPMSGTDAETLLAGDPRW